MVFSGDTALAWLTTAALPNGQVTGDEGLATGGSTGETGTPPPAAFLFELPDEVKTVAMLALAAAIGIYLWRNMMKGE